MRKPLSLLFAFAAVIAASTAFAADKDGVTIGMALEPPTLDPTTGAAAAIGEITHYQHLRRGWLSSTTISMLRRSSPRNGHSHPTSRR